ncbi:MAG: peptidoglycan DD-metalloendopeptidase family protein [Deltaproteobacteria bacterium]|nr:peptidoglycan DD-metalloendopeptidase family protein [Deltaproteobacteria bacterium]MBW1923400.1 peptidoglycan DD-metalloendopeptidase family protein [Deltaproteobacteria bacterium]MBW1949513.1 peptidoglycan DD-metalloendopeptidase family protein [Deltaproteobacteria bacterium]MBW2007364.1 peptidoglycan DD-metalloendopeptidase family protein [Deltaproteobacteria bacterium]MBW2103373.1 peptidoglycan DD-metalloendopeptidase family protein [Deltaproteobacteria bacterium]
MGRRTSKITRNAFVAFMVWVFTAGFSGAWSGTHEAAQDQVRQLEKALMQEKEKYRTLHKKEKGLLEEISDLERVVRDRRRALDRLRKKAGLIRAEEKDLNKRLGRLKETLAGIERRLEKQAVVMYKFLRLKYMRILATADDLDQFRKRVKYIRMLIAQDVSRMEGVLREKLRRQRLVREMRQRVEAVRLKEEEVRNRLRRLKEELESDVFRLVNIRKEKKFYETAVKELQAGARDLRRTLRGLEVAPVRRASAAEHFAQWKGRLPYPMKGRAVRGDRFLKRAAEHFGKGVLIVSRKVVPVRAVGPGRVDFSGKVKGYGNVTIINHGERYFTLYGNLSRVDKKKGARVSAGEIIGKPGTDLGAGRYWIYFEIRKRGQSLNPLKWFGKGKG